MAAGLPPGGPGGAPKRPCLWQCPDLPPLGPGSWLRAAAWQPAAGGGWRGWCEVSASPEGPHVCVLSKRSGLMSQHAESIFGELGSQTIHLWAGSRIAVGLRGSVSPVWKIRKVSSRWGARQPGCTRPENTESGGSAELIFPGLGNRRCFFMKHLLCVQHCPTFSMHWVI